MRWMALACVVAALSGCGGGDRPAAGRGGGEVAVTRGAVRSPDFGDARPHDWSGRHPGAYAVHGIDVSRWQPEVDWHRASASGVSFAFIKATEGAEDLDPRFEAHWAGAGRAGVRRGAYHVFYFCRSGADQARWFIRNVPRDPGGLPPVLDIEWNPFSPTCAIRPPAADVRREAQDFINLLTQHYHRTPVLYTTVDFERDTGIGSLPGVRLWLRSVAGHPSEVYPGRDWTFWQYTSTGLVPGVQGKVDINAFAGSAEAWQRWGG
ncbi:GH25 family lysozyme [Tropicimonas sp. IMCC34043]|uniref:glycoside hydrolase family 25 protein n=1 Tax=Tropicimonas sp. IMCC34043 TaxID=2248760 RepID=UPI000E249758|nr:GH25 family lysozyme [Tropicimonas sp. IMCC34043]